MMRSRREEYFRNESVQKEYRDVVTRLENRFDDAGAKPVRVAGPFDTALAQYMEGKMAAADNPPQVDVSGSSYLFDGGATEARAIFRRDDEIPGNVPEASPEAGVGKGDRLPVSAPAQVSPAAVLPAVGTISPPSAEALDIPLRWDGLNRVEEKQFDQPERPLAIQPILKSQINYAAQKNGVEVEVHSGGQPPKAQRKPQYQTRGPRHDYGNAADVDLYVVENGQRRYLDSKNPDDRKIVQNFMRDALIAGATGIGHGYMWHRGNRSMTTRIHVGGGEARSWRDQTDDPELNKPFPWVEAARQQGEAARKQLVSPEAWPHPVAAIKPGVEAGADGPFDAYTRY